MKITRPFLICALLLPFLLITSASCKNLPEGNPKPEPIDPNNRDGIGTDFGKICENLRSANCIEGYPITTPTKPPKTCFEHLTTLTLLVEVPTACLMNATTKDSIRACGSPDTLRFRCL